MYKIGILVVQIMVIFTALSCSRQDAGIGTATIHVNLDKSQYYSCVDNNFVCNHPCHYIIGGGASGGIGFRLTVEASILLIDIETNKISRMYSIKWGKNSIIRYNDEIGFGEKYLYLSVSDPKGWWGMPLLKTIDVQPNKSQIVSCDIFSDIIGNK